MNTHALINALSDCGFSFFLASTLWGQCGNLCIVDFVVPVFILMEALLTESIRTHLTFACFANNCFVNRIWLFSFCLLFRHSLLSFFSDRSRGTLLFRINLRKRSVHCEKKVVVVFSFSLFWKGPWEGHDMHCLFFSLSRCYCIPLILNRNKTKSHKKTWGPRERGK